MNWPSNTSSKKPDATIIALRKTPTSYNLSQSLQGFRWFCPTTKQVWMFGNEFYGNIKITVRGLCSEIAPRDQMFIHGCAMSINKHGVVLSGSSGAGKTTLTVALKKILSEKVKIVNDDWGPCSLRNGHLKFTGEPYLHMKYPSVQALAPHLDIDPSSYISENFNGNKKDPRARLLIAPNRVFGNNGLEDKVELKLFVVVIRDPEKGSILKYLSERDIPLIEQGKYSQFYNRTEWFLNGSLLIVDEKHKKRERNRHKMLLKNFPCVLINNIDTPKKTANLILSELEKVTTICPQSAS